MCTLQVQEQVAEVEAAGQTLRTVQHMRNATTRRPDAVCSVPVASRTAMKDKSWDRSRSRCRSRHEQEQEQEQGQIQGQRQGTRAGIGQNQASQSTGLRGECRRLSL